MPLSPRLLRILPVLLLLLAFAAAGSAGQPVSAGRLSLAAGTPPPAVTTPVPSSARKYTVQSGDTLGGIAQRFGVSAAVLIQANSLKNPDSLTVGQKLMIPGEGQDASAVAAAAAPAGRASTNERLPERARNAAADSPLHGTTWVTYYGRPNVPILGILGEYSLDDLIPRLRAQAKSYDDANGPDLTVTPALHLIYGMAMTRAGANGDHLSYLEDDVVREYIDRAAWEGMGVILDVQIGSATPLQAIKPAFAYLKYRNVQLALDPEFAMTTPGQTIPGQPPGAITADQINQVQAEMVAYMQQGGFAGHKMLIVHQFLPYMIVAKDSISVQPTIDVVICADGFGPPWPKISKYNAFMSENVQFAGFKLFYRWDEPMMTEDQALGNDPYTGIGYMDVTPSLIVYQ